MIWLLVTFCLLIVFLWPTIRKAQIYALEHSPATGSEKAQVHQHVIHLRNNISKAFKMFDSGDLPPEEFEILTILKRAFDRLDRVRHLRHQETVADMKEDLASVVAITKSLNHVLKKATIRIQCTEPCTKNMLPSLS